MRFVLASQSPRRQQLLQLLRVPFTVRPADIDEAMDPNLPPQQEVARVCRAKAEATPREEEDVVIAADTIVVLEGKVLGKPADPEDAAAMLRSLSGRDHQVMTGLTVVRGHRAITHTEITDVHFRPLTEEEILSYVQTGEPMDKAGSYGIQGFAAPFVEGIRGDYYNVMGLPVCRLQQMLRQLAPEYMEEFQ
jgi:septum formation protein